MKNTIILSLFSFQTFSGESFPRPVFRWLEDEKPREANRTEVAAGTYAGGEIVTSIVEFQARPEHNGKIYQCFAHNPTFYDEMQPELNVTIKLEVLCKYLNWNQVLNYPA